MPVPIRWNSVCSRDRCAWLATAALAAALLGGPVALAQGGASTRPGVGATLYSGSGQSGVTFRTWAPFATSVNVAGTFNLWNVTATPLFAEGNGWWSVDVPGAAAGAQAGRMRQQGRMWILWPRGVPLRQP